MNIAAAGMAIVFFSLLIANVVVGMWVVPQLVHAFTTVLHASAVGTDAVHWGDEPWVDKLGQSLYLIYLVALALAPGGLVLELLLMPLLPESSGLRVILGACLSFWLFFPLVIASALMAGSRWTPVHLPVIQRALRRPGSVVLAYASSALLLGPFAVATVVAIAGLPFLLPLSAILGSTALLIYPRLLGRLVWVLGKVRLPRQHLKKGKPAHGARKKKDHVETYDPWGASPTEEVPEEPVAPLKPPRTWAEADLTPYGFSQDTGETPPAEEGANVPLEEPVPFADREEDLPLLSDEERQKRRALCMQRDPYMEASVKDKPPPLPLVQGVWTFPWYATSLTAWFVMAAYIFLMELLLVPLLAMLVKLMVLSGQGLH